MGVRVRVVHFKTKDINRATRHFVARILHTILTLTPPSDTLAPPSDTLARPSDTLAPLTPWHAQLQHSM